MQVCDMIVYPWVQGNYADGDTEDTQAAIEEKKAASESQGMYLDISGDTTREKQYILSNDISVDPVDGEAIEATHRPRPSSFVEE